MINLGILIIVILKNLIIIKRIYNFMIHLMNLNNKKRFMLLRIPKGLNHKISLKGKIILLKNKINLEL